MRGSHLRPSGLESAGQGLPRHQRGRRRLAKRAQQGRGGGLARGAGRRAGALRGGRGPWCAAQHHPADG